MSGTTPDGTRVAAMLGNGGYAQKVAVPEAFLVPVPDEVNDDQAAGLLLQGITAHALLHYCAHVREGETVVVEAAAGGTGSLAVQLAKRAGAKVIALASSEEKRALAERLGADATADSRADDLTEAIIEANGGEKVDVVLHMSGTGFEAELQGARPARAHRRLRQRRPPPERGRDQLPAPDLEVGDRLLAGAADRQAPRPGRGRDRRAARRGRLRRARGRDRRGLSAERGGQAPTRTSQERRSTGKLLLDPSA